MEIRIHAIGKRMPAWVRDGFEDYAGRFPGHIRLSLREITMPERSSGSVIDRIKAEEAERLLAGVKTGDVVIALDERGKAWDSQQLATHLAEWQQDQRDVNFLVGGPDGLSADCRRQAEHVWSLSKLTLPHMLVRVVLAEQLYRAWSILQGHPYHR